MNYTDAQLLLEIAHLNLKIAQAKAPEARMEVVAASLARSKGYRDLRAWWVSLSDSNKEKGRRLFRDQLAGVREIMRRAKVAGEEVSYADLEISVEIEEDEPLQEVSVGGNGAVMALSVRCPGSDGNISDPINLRVKCTRCQRTWHQNDVGFKIPEHEEQA